MTAAKDRMYAARWDIDAARGHLDTATCQFSNAVGHLNDGAIKAKAVEVLDRLAKLLADIDRLQEVAADQ